MSQSLHRLLRKTKRKYSNSTAPTIFYKQPSSCQERKRVTTLYVANAAMLHNSPLTSSFVNTTIIQIFKSSRFFRHLLICEKNWKVFLKIHLKMDWKIAWEFFQQKYLGFMCTEHVLHIFWLFLLVLSSFLWVSLVFMVYVGFMRGLWCYCCYFHFSGYFFLPRFT